MNLLMGGGGTAHSILTRSGERPCDNYIKEDPQIIQRPHGYNKGRVIDQVSPSITTSKWEENNLLKEPMNPPQRITALLSNKGQKFERETDVASALMSRDYKGFTKYPKSGVLEWKKK